MNRLEGKVGVVTGAALRLGRATCARMAEEGAAISVLDVLDDEGRAPAESLRGQGVMQPHLAGQVARHSVRAFETKSAKAARAPAPLLAGWVRHIGDYAYAMMVFGGMLIVALIITSLAATILR